jgi:hypothetical protein
MCGCTDAEVSFSCVAATTQIVLLTHDPVAFEKPDNNRNCSKTGKIQINCHIIIKLQNSSTRSLWACPTFQLTAHYLQSLCQNFNESRRALIVSYECSGNVRHEMNILINPIHRYTRMTATEMLPIRSVSDVVLKLV